MLNENGLGDHGAHTAGSGESGTDCEEMEDDSTEIAHRHIVARQEDGGFWPNLEFRHPHGCDNHMDTKQDHIAHPCIVPDRGSCNLLG